MDLGNADFFADLKNLGLENLDDDAIREQREETERKVANSAIDSFNTGGGEEPPEDPDVTVDDDSEPQHFTMSDYKIQAEGYIDILDLGNTMVLPGLYRKKLITPDERSRIEHVKRSTEAGQYATLSYEDQKLDKKLAEIQDLIDNIPFTKEERQKLIDALAKVLSYYDMTANPTTVLVLTLIAVEGARLLPFVMRK